MSDLLNKASLVVIPSGYKEDTVYSVVPSDGSGDLSFTRASNGTRLNSAGLVEVCPWNLVSYSEQFTNAAWGVIEAGVTADAIVAPNGTTTADKLKVTTANAGHQLFQSYTSENANHTFSIYAKKGELNYIQLAMGNSVEQYANFDLNTGVVGTKGSYCASSSIESVGNGWYRCTAYFNQGTMPSLMIWLTNSASSNWGGIAGWAGANNTDGIYIWGAQLNIGSTAKPYFPTTDRLNVARLTYQNGGGGCPSLLLEKQSTNSILYSEDITNVQWANAGGTATANTAISPDGTQNADTLTGARYQGGGTSNTWTFSCYAKKVDGDNKFLLRLDVPTTNYAQFDLNLGVIDSISSGYSATITSVGNGWYRCTLTTPSSTSINNIVLVSASGGTYSTYVWGAQIEASSYATSYIPTTSASATRVADACYKTGISSLIGQTEGVMFVDVIYNGSANTGEFNRIINITDGSSSNFISLSKNNSTDELYIYCQTSAGVQVNSGAITGTSLIGRHKIALAYKANDFVLYVDGVQKFVDTSASVPTCSRLNIGSLENFFSSTDQLGGSVSEAILFPTRLTNAELASLTTI